MTKRMPPIWLLVLITLSGTLGIHVFLPALPDAARSLQASPGAMQATISLYIVGLAAGQPIYGPLSDRFGRRPILLAGLLLFTLGGVWSMSASTVASLAAARFFQALGGCAGLVLGRAIVRDTSDVTQAVRRLAMINVVTLIGPGLAPLVGQTILATAGWRFIFLLLTALGAFNLLLSALLLRETAPSIGSMDTAALLRNHRKILSSRPFLGYAIGGGCTTTAMYAFFAAAPFVFREQLHRPPHELAAYLGVMILGAALGSALAGRLAGRLPIGRMMLGGNLVGLASISLLCLSILGGFFTWQLTLGTMIVFTFVAGFVSPMAMTQAMGIDRSTVGLAAGLYGGVQMLVGGICTWLAGMGSNPALSASVVLLAAAVIAHLSFRWAMSAERAVHATGATASVPRS